MENAAATDNESVQANRPALAKHKMLPEVTDMLTKYLKEMVIIWGMYFLLGRTCMKFFWIVEF